MTREEAIKKVTTMGTHPYSIASMTDAFMEGYATAVEKAKMWVCKDCDHCIADVDRKARCPRLDSLRKAMEE